MSRVFRRVFTACFCCCAVLLVAACGSAGSSDQTQVAANADPTPLPTTVPLVVPSATPVPPTAVPPTPVPATPTALPAPTPEPTAVLDAAPDGPSEGDGSAEASSASTDEAEPTPEGAAAAAATSEAVPTETPQPTPTPTLTVAADAESTVTVEATSTPVPTAVAPTGEPPLECYDPDLALYRAFVEGVDTISFDGGKVSCTGAGSNAVAADRAYRHSSGFIVHRNANYVLQGSSYINYSGTMHFCVEGQPSSAPLVADTVPQLLIVIENEARNWQAQGAAAPDAFGASGTQC